jgi:hypothetical protein
VVTVINAGTDSSILQVSRAHPTIWIIILSVQFSRSGDNLMRVGTNNKTRLLMSHNSRLTLKIAVDLL